MKLRRNAVDLTGKRFGMLTVLEAVDRKNGFIIWECKCDCGNISRVYSNALRQGRTKSCGCRQGNHKHDISNTRVYGIYIKMLHRCSDPKVINSKNYMQRGITVCEEWASKGGEKRFYKWAMENGYSDELSLDRIDNNGNYEPSNCRWATVKEQGRNKRNNRNLTLDGETKPLSEWAEYMGMSASTLTSRLNRRWSVRDALCTPVGVCKKYHRY